MNRRQTSSFLSHLCALLPHTAPAVLDPELVTSWHNAALHDLPGDLAFEIADAMTVHWASCYFPKPADFNEWRRRHRTHELGVIDTARAGLIAARAAIRNSERIPAA